MADQGTHADRRPSWTRALALALVLGSAALSVACSRQPLDGADSTPSVPGMGATGSAVAGSMAGSPGPPAAGSAGGAPTAVLDASAPAADPSDAGGVSMAVDANVPTLTDDASVMAAPVLAETGFEDAPCLAGIAGYAETGPFTFVRRRLERVNVWVPDVPPGCKVPVVHLSNGTGASCDTYLPVLEHLASHGFVTSCFEHTATGDGSQCLDGVETTFAAFPELAAPRVGSTGHAAGGQGAFLCVFLAQRVWHGSRLLAVHAAEPESGFGSQTVVPWHEAYAEITAPVFIFNGSEDVLVSASWVGRSFDALPGTTEAYWYEGVGAPHIPIPARWVNESAVAWFRWKLLGDPDACEHFKAMPASADWDLQGMRNETGC